MYPATSIFDRFSGPATMMDAEFELLAMGSSAVPLIESLLTGEAKNLWGVPYRSLGLPLRCTLEVVRRLGSLAKPLERYLRAEVRRGDHVAAMCLGSLGSLENASIIELASALSATNVDLSFESAAAIARCGAARHAAVLRALDESPRAREAMQVVKERTS